MLAVLGRYAEPEGLFGGLIQPCVGLVLYFLIGPYLLLPVRTVRRWLRRGGG